MYRDDRKYHGDNGQAKLVCPPEKFLERLIVKGDEKLRSLITGRGRPGRNPKAYIARYNSGIKTLPIGAKSLDQVIMVQLLGGLVSMIMFPWNFPF